MKVLYISTADYKYGAAKTQIDMILELKKQFDVVPVVLTKKHNAFNELCNKHGIENYSYWYRDIMAGSAYSNSILNVLKHIVKYVLYLKGGLTQKGVLSCGIKWEEIDIIHSNHIRIDIGAYIRRKTGIPHIWHIKELNKGHIKIIHYKMHCYQYINKNADKFIAVTNQVKDYWQRTGLDSKKIEVIYEGIDIDKFLSVERHRTDDELKMVCVGRVEKSKGQLQILQAMTMLPFDIREKVTLDLIGEPYLDYLHQLKNFIKNNGLENQVSFKGYCEDIPQILAGYDVGILASKGDAFGTVTAEYMAAGLLTIATYTELIEHKKTGLRYEFDDIKQLNENICFAYRNKEAARKIAMEGKREISLNYSIAQNAGEVYQLYKKVMKDER